MKRNVLASFTDVLLLPVTIVPKAVGGIGSAIVEGGKGGMAMLNMQNWGTGGGTRGAGEYYSREFGGEMLFDGEGENEGVVFEENTGELFELGK